MVCLLPVHFITIRRTIGEMTLIDEEELLQQVETRKKKALADSTDMTRGKNTYGPQHEEARFKAKAFAEVIDLVKSMKTE